ncbi:MAG: InlB B-repeat-containing protein [Oscillospiraceae bacterium]|nr:InlB B-repeat-containing protein [Oscillospiraceae bacterium]
MKKHSKSKHIISMLLTVVMILSFTVGTGINIANAAAGLTVTLDGVGTTANIDLGSPGATLRIAFSDVGGVGDKKITVTIPEGLTLVAYDGQGGAWADTTLDGLVTATPSLTTATGRIYGTVEYALDVGVIAGVLELKVAVDSYRYYGPHTVPGGITVVYTDDASTTITENIAVTTTNTGVTGFSNQITFSQSDRNVYTTLGVSAKSMYSQTQKDYNGYTYSPYWKAAVFTLKYPAEAVVSGVWFGSTAATSMPTDITAMNVSIAASGGNEAQYTGPIYNASGDEIVANNSAYAISINTATREVKFYAGAGVNASPGLYLTFPTSHPPDQAVAGGTYNMISSVYVTAYDGTHPAVTSSGAATATMFHIANAATNRLDWNDSFGKNWSVAVPYPANLEGLTVIHRPTFMNKTGAELTDQVVTYTFPEDLGVRGFDLPIAAAPPSNQLTITYTATDGSTPHTETGVVVTGTFGYGNSSGNGGRLRIAPSGIPGLGANDVITSVTAAVGDFPADYKQGINSSDGCGIFGNLAPTATGVYNIGVSFNSTTTGDSNVAVAISPPFTSTVVTAHTSMTRLITEIKPHATHGVNFFGEDDIEVTTTLNTYSGIFTGTIQRVSNPDFFIYLPEGVNLKPGSLTLTQTGGTPTIVGTPDVQTNCEGTGRTLVRVHTNGVIGWMNENLLNYNALILKFTMTPDTTVTGGSFNTTDLVFASGSAGDPFLPISGTNSAIKLESALNIDINGDTDKLDTVAMQSGGGTNYSLSPKKAFTVTSAVRAGDTGPLTTYIPGTDTTIVSFTEGTVMEYHLGVVNNLDSPAGGFTAYVPVPHFSSGTGTNYGSNFQSVAAEWDMKLSGAPTPGPSTNLADYTITYSTDAIAGNSHASATYSPTPSSWDAVTMIKIINNAAIPNLTNDTIIFKFIAGANADSADTNSDSYKRNIFNPYYHINATSVVGDFAGKPVAMQLVEGSVSGTVWLDENGDGLMNGTEAGVAGIPVRLRLPGTGAGNAYAPGGSITVHSDAVGKYAEILTSGTGTYTFPDIPSSTIGYDLEVAADRNRYNFTVTDAVSSPPSATDDQIDSDVDANGKISPVNIADLAVSQYIGAGLVLRDDYVVKYDVNGGTPTISDVTGVEWDDDGFLPSPLPQKNGEDPIRWDVSVGGTRTNVTDLHKFSELAENGATSVTLKAIYPTHNTFTETYSISYAYTGTVPTGAPSAPSTVSGVEAGESRSVASAPSLTGWTFSGWATSDTSVSGGSFTMPSGNVRFTGSWTAKTHNVTYAYTGTVPAGAPAKPSDMLNVAYGTSVTVADEPTLTGYTFVGWEVSGATVTGGGFTMPDNDVTITGHWQRDGEPPEPTPTPTPTLPPDIIVNDPDVPPDVIIDDDGSPLGEWVWDEEIGEWIFDEFPPLADFDAPDTGEKNAILWLIPAIFAIAGVAYILSKRERIK